MIKKEAGGEVTVAGTGGVWSHCPCSQAAGNDQCPRFLCSIRPKTHAHGVGMTAFRVSLHVLIDLIKIIPHRHG